MKLNRRQLFKRTLLASALLATPQIASAASRPALRIPPLLDIGRGRPLQLNFRTAQTQFEKGKLVDVWGVNGQYLAPTVRVKSGDFVKLTYSNNLPQTLSVNVQGLRVPTEMLGSAHRQLTAKSSWSPIVSVQQAAATGWYHADTLFQSAYQTYRGIAGLWIIEDAQSKTAQLPNKYGVNDIPLILQDQQLNDNGVQLLDTNQPQFFGKRVFVNGQESPYFNVARGWIRLRVLNASLSRSYDLQLDNGKPLHLIATGVGMLQAPVEMAVIKLAPSERVEVLIDLNEGETVSLISGEKRNLLYQAKQLFSDNQDLADNVILELRPEGLVSVFNQQPSLPEFPLDEFNLTISQERKFTLRPLDRLINGQRFDPKRLDFTAKLGSVERWYLNSTEAVGFTLQGAKFVLETRSRQAEPHKQLAWRDTVWLEKDQEVTLLVKFDHKASAELPFSFGVSDKMLRDRGCQGQFAVE